MSWEMEECEKTDQRISGDDIGHHARFRTPLITSL